MGVEVGVVPPCDHSEHYTVAEVSGDPGGPIKIFLVAAMSPQLV